MKYLKTILLQAGICFLFLTASAQPKAGIKAGLNHAGLSGYNGKNLLNFHGGIFFQVALNEKLRIQPELLYSGEGQHHKLYDNENVFEYTIAVRYVQLPLVIQYFPVPAIYVEVGPQMAVLAAAYYKGTDIGYSNVKRRFGKTSFGMYWGIGGLINQRIGLYGRYCFWLSEITPDDNDINKSSTAQIGISFYFKKKNSGKKITDKPRSL